jgi:SprT protein|tara:strand:+ start:585 stop:1103 length:519 start_codon:yes stop_codon:yes gene_type:complete
MTTTVTNEIRQRVNDRIAQLDDLCADIFGREIAPSISYGLKGKVAGQAWLSKNSIKINAYCLMNNLDDYIKQTLGHEYAHLLVHQEHGFNVQPHGHEWKRAMVKLGLPPNRCHNYQTVAGRKTVKYQYSCVKCGRIMELGSIRHKKIASGKSTYSHGGGCGGRLKYDHIRKG